MGSNKLPYLFSGLIFILVHSISVLAVTDAELDALEKATENNRKGKRHNVCRMFKTKRKGKMKQKQKQISKKKLKRIKNDVLN